MQCTSAVLYMHDKRQCKCDDFSALVFISDHVIKSIIYYDMAFFRLFLILVASDPKWDR